MLTVNCSDLRENLKSYMDAASDDFETVVVTRKENRNIVMISEAVYNNIMENMHLLSNKENYDWLMESKAQLEAGRVITEAV